MSWTDERIELLRKLWLDGMSASRIASELANGLTRNAVIGKVYRLGLSGRAKPQGGASGMVEVAPRAHIKPAHRAAAAAPLATPVVHGNTALAFNPSPSPIPVAAEPVPEMSEDVVVAFAEPVTIVDLRESMCRWPIGDPGTSEFRFCGAAKRVGAGPYCAHHAGIAYQPQHDRRRVKTVPKPV
jgi:GcrA cell cycle regulator